MTKSEFVQRVAIALASNPKFADYCKLDVISIVDEADRLARVFEDRSDYGGLFDDEDCDTLSNISNELYNIREVIGGENSDESNIRQTLWGIEESLKKIAEKSAE